MADGCDLPETTPVLVRQALVDMSASGDSKAAPEGVPVHRGRGRGSRGRRRGSASLPEASGSGGGQDSRPVPNVRSPRGRNWAITLFGPPSLFLEWGSLGEAAIKRGDPDGTIRYFVGTTERCPETGRSHIQGYVQFSEPVRITHPQAVFGSSGHYELARGTPQQNEDYCTKNEADGVTVRFGIRSQQGARTDIAHAWGMLKEGKSDREIIEERPSILRCYGALRFARMLLAPVRDWEMEVLVFYGPTRTGKSRLAKAFADTQSSYWFPKLGGCWFDDNYVGQHTVILDEFKGGFPVDYLLGLLDRYPFTAPIKGASRVFHSRRVIITSNYSYESWYDRLLPETLEALARRLKIIVHFSSDSCMVEEGAMLFFPLLLQVDAPFLVIK